MAALTFILGCTGSGKGSLGRELATRYGGEILSIDSMKIYRRMDIGTAKPSAEAQALVPHHGIDLVEPWEEFSVASFVEHAETCVRDMEARARPIFCVGGTALYIKSLTEGLFEGPGADPAIRTRLRGEAESLGNAALHARLMTVDPSAAGRIHPNDLRRLVRALEVHELTGRPITELQTQWDRDRTRHDCTFIGLRRELTDQNHRTNSRVRRMIAQGLMEEARNLFDSPCRLSDTARKAVGYAELFEHFHGVVSLEEAIENIKINTRQFAKAQRTWFKRFRQVHWIELQPDSTVEHVADVCGQQWGHQWSMSPRSQTGESI